jgi:hypothetical protein
MKDQRVCSFNAYGIKKVLEHGSKTTLYSAAVTSPATARLAGELGLQINADDSLQWIAGLHADVQTVTVLHELGMPLSDTVVNAVALSGRLDILRLLVRDLHCSIPRLIGQYGTRSGSISMLNWLKETDLCNCKGSECTTAAAAAGQLAALQYLINNNCEWDEDYIACYAASSGSIDVMTWLRQQPDIVIDAEAMSFAAGAGHIAMCQYLRSSGCNWDTSACAAAAGTDHLDVLRWLRDNGCPWNVREVCLKAASNEFINIHEYVIEQDEVLGTELLTDALNLAGSRNKLQAAQRLRQHGAQWPAVLKYKA